MLNPLFVYKNLMDKEREYIKSIEYREEMEKKLLDDFWFMKDDDGTCFPMEWGNGWLAEFYELCRQLTTEVSEDFKWAQLKEKYGGARCYYWGHITPYGEELICQFEIDMQSVCEVCGEPSTLRTDGWWMSLCDQCYKENLKEEE